MGASPSTTNRSSLISKLPRINVSGDYPGMSSVKSVFKLFVAQTIAGILLEKTAVVVTIFIWFFNSLLLFKYRVYGDLRNSTDVFIL